MNTLRKFKHDNVNAIPDLVTLMECIDVPEGLIPTWQSLVNLITAPEPWPCVVMMTGLADILESMGEMNAAEFKVSGGKLQVFIKTGTTDNDPDDDDVAE